jgi:Holliday junction resolvase RusA-like endonuclease
MAHGKLLLDVKIPGTPPSKERARTFSTLQGKIRTVTPKKTRSWEQIATAHFRIAWGARKAIVKAPVSLLITAVMARPERLLEGAYKDRPGRLPCLTTPDVDNIEKIVMDALAPSRTTKKKAWICILANDSAVVDARTRKLYAAVGEKAHVRIQLFEWAPDEDMLRALEPTADVTSDDADEDEDRYPGISALRHKVSESNGEPSSSLDPVVARYSMLDARSSSLTLAEARQAVRDVADEGSACPCCDQLVKRYRRPLNAIMARGLLWLVKASGPELQWIHVNAVAPKWLTNKGGSLATLSHWELIEQRPKEDLPAGERSTKRTSGFWRPTAKGVAFAGDTARVPSHVVLYDNQVEGWSDREIGIRDALGKAFDYGELMRGDP